MMPRRRARASHPQTRWCVGCGAAAPVLARLMVAVDMVVAAVLLDCCSLAQGAPERAPANRLEVTSERPARLLLAVGRQAAARASGRRGRVGAGSRGPWGTWTRSDSWIMQHSHTGATEGQSLEVTEMALLLVPGWRPDLPKKGAGCPGCGAVHGLGHSLGA